jgi:hypothetical protein
MKYYKIEVQRTYTTEVYVKCEDEKIVQRILDATPDRRDDWDAKTNLWDYIFDEEMQQCNVTETNCSTVDESYQTEHEIYLYAHKATEFFDLDNELKKTNA